MATSNDCSSKSFTGADYDDDEAGSYAEQVLYNMSLSMVMQTAIELDLFEIIAEAKGISAIEIADKLPAANKEEAAHKVDRMLRVLAAFSLLTCSVDSGGRRVYGLAPAGRYFVRDDDGASFGPLLCLNQNKIFIDGWRKLKDAVLEGGLPFNKAHGMRLYDFLNSDPSYNHLFNLGFAKHTTTVMKKLLERYKGFENLKQLVDVGGGVGDTLKMIVSKYPSLKGINFDLPHVVEEAVPIPGIEHVGGDMFESVPSPTEAVLVKWIFPSFSDDQCVKMLKNCYSALPNNGKVISIESIIEEEPKTSAGAKANYLKDVLFMTRHLGGRERTRKEFMALANAAGFTTVKFECCACNFWVMEFCK